MADLVSLVLILLAQAGTGILVLAAFLILVCALFGLGFIGYLTIRYLK